MDSHENARTTRRGRMLIVCSLASGWSAAAVATAQGITPKTVRKWRDRHAVHGEAGLMERFSRPHRSPTRTAAAQERATGILRRHSLSSPAIARKLGRPVSTVGQVLRRQQLGRLSALDPRLPIQRYERERHGELIHIDIKNLARIDGVGHRITGNRTGQSSRRARKQGLGWEYLHVAIDDRSRLAWFARHGITVERVMTDNGSAQKSKMFAAALQRHGIRHKRTRPYTPKTNVKAKRFIQSTPS